MLTHIVCTFVSFQRLCIFGLYGTIQMLLLLLLLNYFINTPFD